MTENELEINKSTEKKEQPIDENGPSDSYNFVYITFFVLGIMRILPWSFFLMANDYWMYKFRNTTLDYHDSEVRTQLQVNFFSSLSITLNVSDEVFLIVSYLFGNKLGLNLRAVGSLCGILSLFVLSAGFIYVNTDPWQNEFFGLSLAIVAIISATNTIFGMAMYSLLSCFPPKYLAPYITGQGVSAIFTSCLQLLSMLVAISSQASAAVYFGLGIFVNVLSITVLALATRTPIYHNCMIKYHSQKRQKIFDYQEVKSILWKMWPTLAIFATYILSHSPIHTSVTSLVASEFEGENDWGDLYFVPTATYLVPNCFDVLGRVLANIPKFQLGTNSMMIYGVLRIAVFVPLIVFCNAQPRHHFPLVFPHDYQYMIIMVAYMFTNGYLLGMCAVTIQKLLTAKELETGFHVFNVGSSTLNSAFSPLAALFVNLL